MPIPIDVLYLEYDSMYAQNLKDAIEKKGLRYERTSSLSGFKMALSWYSPKLYVIGGKFPEKERLLPEFNAEKAIDLIRKKKGDDVKIYLLSGSPQSPEVAQKLNVDYINKLDSIEKIVGKLIEDIKYLDKIKTI